MSLNRICLTFYPSPPSATNKKKTRKKKQLKISQKLNGKKLGCTDFFRGIFFLGDFFRGGFFLIPFWLFRLRFLTSNNCSYLKWALTRNLSHYSDIIKPCQYQLFLYCLNVQVKILLEITFLSTEPLFQIYFFSKEFLEIQV